MRNEPEDGANHHCKETILKPSGAFEEEERATEEDREEEEEQTFEDCSFHDGEMLINSTSTVKAFFAWNAISIFSTSSAP